MQKFIDQLGYLSPQHRRYLLALRGTQDPHIFVECREGLGRERLAEPRRVSVGGSVWDPEEGESIGLGMKNT